MKNLFLLPLLLLPFLVFSQNDKIRFSIEGTIGMSENPTFNDGSVPSNVQSIFSELEQGILAYDLGGIASIQLSEKWEFQTGFKVLVEGNKIEKKDLRFGSDFMGFDDEGNPILVPSPENPKSLKLIDRSLYLEIPARFNLQLKGKLNAFKLSFGQSPTFNILNMSKSIKYFENGEEEKNTVLNESTNFRRINFNTQFGIIWEKELKNGNALYLSPNARIQTFGRSKGAALNRRYFFYGISMGIKI